MKKGLILTLLFIAIYSSAEDDTCKVKIIAVCEKVMETIMYDNNSYKIINKKITKKPPKYKDIWFSLVEINGKKFILKEVGLFFKEKVEITGNILNTIYINNIKYLFILLDKHNEMNFESEVIILKINGKNGLLQFSIINPENINILYEIDKNVILYRRIMYLKFYEEE